MDACQSGQIKHFQVVFGSFSTDSQDISLFNGRLNLRNAWKLLEGDCEVFKGPSGHFTVITDGHDLLLV